MPIDLYPNIAKVKRNGVYQNLPGFVQTSGDTDIKAMIASSETSTTAQFPHEVGSYFILNDVLYQADENIAVNDIIAVGTNCHVAVLANNVAKLEEDDKIFESQKDITYNILNPTWEQGSINASGNLSSTIRIRTKDYLDVSEYEKIHISINTNYEFEIDFYNSSKVNTGYLGWVKTASTIMLDGTFKYIRVIVRKSNNSDITPSEVENSGINIQLFTKLVTEIQNIQNVMGESPYFAENVYLSGSYVVTRDQGESRILIFPIKNNHSYSVVVHNANRQRCGLSDNYYPLVGETITGIGSDVSTATTNSAFSFKNTANKKYCYVYCYNSNVPPTDITYEIIDITEQDHSKPVKINGLWVRISTNTIVKGGFEYTIVYPIAKNTNYRIEINGGNRRNIALGTEPNIIDGTSITGISGVASTERFIESFNSGNNTYLYVYPYTSEAEQEYDAIINLIELNNDGLSKIYKYTNYHTSSIVPNDGVPFIVGEYNLAKFNNDTSTYISDEKIHNIKEIIGEINADVLFINEDTGYIDSEHTKSSHEYIFQPAYPFVVGSTNEKLYSKTSFLTNENKTSPNGRAVTFATINNNSNTILLVLVHAQPGVSAANITARSADLTWLMNQIEEITYDYLIIGGDFNPEAGEDDLSNMETAFANYIMCNGGRFDYLNTWFDPAKKYNDVIAQQMPLDYIITSENIICNNFKVYTEEFYNLYSDHVPVVANLTLLPIT